MNQECLMEASSPEVDEQRWQAVLSRDAGYDGAFVYGVRSTGIFCRPSCPSRRPQRERVRFFDDAQAAGGAGFRACKRCQPDQLLASQTERVQRACRLIEANLDDVPSLEELSKEVGSTPTHLQRTFKQVTGITPREYADARRLDQVKTKLREGEAILPALFDAGYGSSRALYERAPGQLGMTPATYRRGGAGTRIRFSIVSCSLGFLIVAATDKGICAVALGDTEAYLEAELRQEFPAAELQRDDAQLREWVEQILGYLEGSEPHLDLPLDVRATAFQWQVWQELRAIAYGQTRSYTQVAQAIGQPTAARAVARACATNPVSLVVPCHRVVRGDGSLSGYRWGLERKRALLERERAGS